MDALLAAHTQQATRQNLSPALNSVSSLISLLQSTRDSIAANPDHAALHLAKTKAPLKESFAKIEEDLKDVNRGLNAYQKALKDKFKNASLPVGGAGVLDGQGELIDRAIAMHLLREGKFGVASAFVEEVNERPRRETEKDGGNDEAESATAGWPYGKDGDEEEDMQTSTLSDEDLLSSVQSSGLQAKFSEMYHILDALRNAHNLSPAVAWARAHSAELEARGSNLEFELARLKFVELYTTEELMSDDCFAGPLRALEYARETFPSFSQRYARETSSLLGSLAFSPDLQKSPYSSSFTQTSYTEACASFTQEFCSLLGLSSVSPLYTAITAGGIALPILEKVERVMAQARGQWTSVNELPVETPLPRGMQFHQIFVCPVSKEQGRDSNPPMMLPCGHVIAKESLEGHAKGKSRVKCPYCPVECRPSEAKRVYI
jgi:hypothetical protein